MSGSPRPPRRPGLWLPIAHLAVLASCLLVMPSSRWDTAADLRGIVAGLVLTVAFLSVGGFTVVGAVFLFTKGFEPRAWRPGLVAWIITIATYAGLLAWLLVE